jgi:hypothetical protein
MNKELYKMVFGSAVRHGLTALSTYLVAQNMLTPEHAPGFVDNLSTYLFDAAPAILAFVWSYTQKVKHHEAQQY